MIFSKFKMFYIDNLPIISEMPIYWLSIIFHWYIVHPYQGHSLWKCMMALQCLILDGITSCCMLLHHIAWYFMVLYDIALFCILLLAIALYGMVLPSIAWYCMTLLCFLWYCILLHSIEWHRSIITLREDTLVQFFLLVPR